MQDKSRYNRYLAHCRNSLGNARLDPDMAILEALHAAYYAGRCAEIAEQVGDAAMKAEADRLINTLLNLEW